MVAGGRLEGRGHIYARGGNRMPAGSDNASAAVEARALADELLVRTEARAMEREVAEAMALGFGVSNGNVRALKLSIWVTHGWTLCWLHSDISVFLKVLAYDDSKNLCFIIIEISFFNLSNA